MTDKLIERLRDWPHMGEGIAGEAADRIDELEAKLKAALQDADEAEAYAWELEQRLAKAEVIIFIVASDKWDERLGEAVDLSCEYLAELKGQDDE